jgi:tRNA threonylcarbamoyladenosine biosynthesis protein TsaB
MALILNIETATNVCSVALAHDGELMCLKESLKDKSHSALLSVFIDETLRENNLSAVQLDAVAVSKGPGSYTGLRIGVSVAKGLCYGSNKPLISVNTLKAMACGMLNLYNQNKTSQSHPENSLFCPMIDARRMEVFTAIYDHLNNVIEDTRALIVEPSSFDIYLTDKKLIFFGSGAKKIKDIIHNKNAIFFDNYNTSARNMINLSEEAFRKMQFENVAYFEPFYLKDFIATVPKKKHL